jgi:hypothetical protein
MIIGLCSVGVSNELVMLGGCSFYGDHGNIVHLPHTGCSIRMFGDETGQLEIICDETEKDADRNLGI